MVKALQYPLYVSEKDWNFTKNSTLHVYLKWRKFQLVLKMCVSLNL